MYKTQEAMAKAGVTRPTFNHRVKTLRLQPQYKVGDSAKYWTEEQIAQIANPPARCPDCSSPYHDACYLTTRRGRNDPDRHIISQKDSPE